VDAPQVSRSGLSTSRPHGVRSPPCSRSATYWPGLPLSCTAVFAAASGGRCLRTLHGYSPRFTHAPSSPLPRVQDTGREVPALGCATRHAACRLRYVLIAIFPFPPTRFQSSGYSGTIRISRPPGGPLGAGRELHPPRYRPSYRAPPIGFGSAGVPVALPPLVSRDTLSTGLLRTRHGDMGSPRPAARTRTGFPAPSPGGCYPTRTLSASPNVRPRVPPGLRIAVEGAYAPALRLVLREPGFPPARSSPGVRPRDGSP